MLRITVLNDERGATFKLEGKLTHEWVAEAEKAWTAFSHPSQPQRLVVDLCAVSFVDDAGRELLARMHSSGAKLIGTGPMTRALIEGICGDDRPRGGSWVRGVLSVFFLLALAGLAHGDNFLIDPWEKPTPEPASFETQECIVAVHEQVRFISVPGDRLHDINLRKGLSR
jgi:anti-anti-sigma regulatory factor